MDIDERVELWLKDNPEAPEYVVNFLRRGSKIKGKRTQGPEVTDHAKRSFMDSHAFVKALVNELRQPQKITKVDSIQEAADIVKEDIKKGSN